LCAAALAVLLVTDGLEQNPGSGVEAESIMQVSCSGCDRNLILGTHCDMCGSWCHISCENVIIQVAENGKWICDRCRWEKMRLLEEKPQNALFEIEDLRRKNKRIEEQLRVAANGSEVSRYNTAQGHREGKICLVFGGLGITGFGNRTEKYGGRVLFGD
jgi:hypothetical protein